MIIYTKKIAAILDVTVMLAATLPTMNSATAATSAAYM
jgi:hypothetical protein